MRTSPQNLAPEKVKETGSGRFEPPWIENNQIRKFPFDSSKARARVVCRFGAEEDEDSRVPVRLNHSI